MAAQNYVLLRNFSTHTARRLRAKRMERNTNQQTTSGSVPHRHEDMDSATLLTLSAMGIHGARVEVLKRHIMVVDQCSRREAVEVSERNDVDPNFDGALSLTCHSPRGLI